MLNYYVYLFYQRDLENEKEENLAEKKEKSDKVIFY